jgi:hypothetical protein
MAVATVFGASIFPRLHHVEHVLGLAEKAKLSASARGERRVEPVRQFVESALEVSYKEMVFALHELECLRRKRRLPKRLQFGSSVSTVASWTASTLPGFIDVEAARIRNAANHHQWHYNLKTGLIHLHDESGWKLSISPGALHARCKDQFRSVAAFVQAAQWVSATSYLRLMATTPFGRLFDPIEQTYAIVQERCKVARWRPRWSSNASGHSSK